MLVPEARANVGSAFSPENMARKHQSILLIDDEASQRRFARRALEGAGYNVLEGADYDEALAVHSRYRGTIDIVLTDISLPGRNGYELVKALLAVDAGLSAIFMSGIAGSEVCRYYGMATSDLHFLEKPFSAAKLVRRVRLILKTGGPFLAGAAGLA